MRKFFLASILVLPLLATSMLSNAANDPAEGRWKTIDDQTGKAKSIVEIKKAADGTFSGTIVEILQSDKGPNPMCTECSDDRKDKPIKGMQIIRGMKRDGEQYSGGTILKPDEGKVYKSKMKLIEEGKKLEVSGCIAFICKSQTWLKQ